MFVAHANDLVDVKLRRANMCHELTSEGDPTYAIGIDGLLHFFVSTLSGIVEEQRRHVVRYHVLER